MAIIRLDNIEEKLKYLGLNLDNVPKQLQHFRHLNFVPVKGYDESQTKQYRYVPIKDIQILLSPTHRADPIDKRYGQARPLYDYLDSKSERNVINHATFLRMLQSVKISDIEKVDEEQKELNKRIPFRVKYSGNYFWQIYYSEDTNEYFMLVPTEDSDYAAFFYLLKKQLENRRVGKVFVPVRNLDYSSRYLKRSQFEDLENYLWVYTNDWPFIYEVHDRLDNLSIQIIGETEVCGKIKSPYRIKLSNKEESIKFYKLLKAMFILQTELPQFFKFRTNIAKTGGIDFYFEKQLIEYENIPSFIKNQFKLSVEKEEEVVGLIDKYEKMLKDLKIEATTLELEYLTKERQISTFLECKKTFFGKVKYYFKYSKKKSPKKQKENIEKAKNEKIEKIKEEKVNNPARGHKKKTLKENYTIEELIKQCKEYGKLENQMKNLLMDINAIKLKNKNMNKKIENATMFIKEIDSHKKSIFEFWKYSNKDEVAALAEGEAEEVNIIKNVKKAFDYKEDLESFGENLDSKQRRLLNKEEIEAAFIASTSQFDILNKVRNGRVLPKDIEISLKLIKQEQKEEQEKNGTENDEFDVFGGMMETKIREINSKRHRETPRDKYKILDVNKNSKQIGFKLTLERIAENLNRALQKIQLEEDIIVYKAIPDSRLKYKDTYVFDLNPEEELKRAFSQYNTRITLYKICLKKGTHAVGFTNGIYFDNEHKTLPFGMNFTSKILVDINKIKIEEIDKNSFKMIKFDDEKQDFTDVTIRTVNLVECEQKTEEDS